MFCDVAGNVRQWTCRRAHCCIPGLLHALAGGPSASGPGRDRVLFPSIRRDMTRTSREGNVVRPDTTGRLAGPYVLEIQLGTRPAMASCIRRIHVRMPGTAAGVCVTITRHCQCPFPLRTTLIVGRARSSNSSTVLSSSICRIRKPCPISVRDAVLQQILTSVPHSLAAVRT